MNKPAKDFMKRYFEEWYAQQLTEQFVWRDIETADMQPVSLGLPVLKELGPSGAKWMVEMAEYFDENFKIIVNGFARAGILRAPRQLQG